MIVLTLLCLTVTIVSAKNVPPFILDDGLQYFEDFIKANNKVYSNDEEKAMRYGIFLQNLKEINLLNAKHEYAEFGVNMFTDLTIEEFLRSHTCFIHSPEASKDCKNVTSASVDNTKVLGIPSELDWRTRNAVTSVKNQGHCGSCWAFSAVGNVESINAIKTGELLDLSEQQVIDCDDIDSGCYGGNPVTAIQYFMDKGAVSSRNYPYQAANQYCKYDAGKVAVNVSGCVEIQGSEDHLAEQLYSIGPLSIGIDASGLLTYHKGILHGDSCKHGRLNHAVLLVGYGVDSESGLSYWLVKNSWGDQIEEKGYFRMQRGVNCLNITGFNPVSAVID